MNEKEIAAFLKEHIVIVHVKDDTLYRCYACQGNGLIAYPYQPLETCDCCHGTGKATSEHQKKYRDSK